MGYKQRRSLDYLETFAVVVKPIINKCLFAVEVKRGYQIRYMDVVTAFLYGFLDRVIYIKQPHLFVTKLDKVCQLIKALYRLKQPLYVWYKTFVEEETGVGTAWTRQ